MYNRCCWRQLTCKSTCKPRQLLLLLPTYLAAGMSFWRAARETIVGVARKVCADAGGGRARSGRRRADLSAMGRRGRRGRPRRRRICPTSHHHREVHRMVSDVPLHAALTRAGADQLAERWRPSAARATRASWAPSSGEGGSAMTSRTSPSAAG